MKKLLLLSLLLLTFFSSVAQKQSREVFTQIIVREGDNEPVFKDAENIIYFNYGNEPVLKIYFQNGEVQLYEQISKRSVGHTNNGLKYYTAVFQKVNSTFKFHFQVFEDSDYGCRMVFSNGNSLQFVN